MILQALMEYYHREKMPPAGFDSQEINFVIVLDRNGNFVDFEDTRERTGNRLHGRPFIVPMAKERSGRNAWRVANIMWDHKGYVLGHPKDESREAMDRANKQHRSFCKKTGNIAKIYPSEPEFTAVSTFLAKSDFNRIYRRKNWRKAAAIPGCNISFRMAGKNRLVSENGNLLEYVRNEKAPAAEREGPADDFYAHCLVTGSYGKMARLQPQTPLPTKKSRSNAKIISFQRNRGYDSYGKEQSYNSPISIPASGAYGKALNHLLRSRQRINLGSDDSMIFWAEKPDELETRIPDIFNEPFKDEDPDRNAKAVRFLYRSMETGALDAGDRPANRFYVLCLAPNAGRISIRFWHVTTLKKLAVNILRHFEDFTLAGPLFIKQYPALQSLLKAITRTSDKHPFGCYEDIPQNLSGDMMVAILNSVPYPATLFSRALRRLSAEGDIPPKGEKLHGPRVLVDHFRFSIVKACLNRKTRFSNPMIKEELKMALDESNKNTGYRLGRLFAGLEKIQLEAIPGINATIRNRYYGAASGTPGAVFPILIRMKNHLLAKLANKNRAVDFEKLLLEIIDGISDFPAQLSLDDQGRFAIGYYHQTQKFYQKP